ncbi:MAG: hypothetical protein AB1486_32305 [Planctomycetota bacterium]
MMKTMKAAWPGLIFCLTACCADMEGSGIDDFEAGLEPTAWKPTITGDGRSRWTVEEDATAPSGTKVLKQGGLTPGSSFPLCLKEGPLFADGFVEVKFKTVSGEIDQAAGVVWRARNEGNYYVCRANALEDNVVLYKLQAGKRTPLDIVGRQGGYGVEEKVAPAQWHTLRVEFAGERFEVLFDGRKLFAVEDRTFAGSGVVGLWTKADSVTLFDDFRWGGR